MKLIVLKTHIRSLAVTFMVLMSLLSTLAFAGKGADGSGGGSGIAAEITRSTDDFFAAVKRYPELFPGVDAVALKNMKVEILVTVEPIKTCKNKSDLEAWSDVGQGYSKFYIPAWLGKDAMGKMQLAGHERLVIAGLEKSNQYDLSNQIYEVKLKDLEKHYGKARSLCSFGEFACTMTKLLENNIARLLSHISNGDIATETPDSLKGSMSILIHMAARGIVVAEKSRIDEKFIKPLNPEKYFLDYTNKVTLALDRHFNPLIRHLEELIAAKNGPAVPETCVEL